MRKYILIILVNIIVFTSFSQIPTPSFEYLFTGASLGDLVQTGSAMTAIPDRVNSTSDAISLNGDYFSRSAFNTNDLTISFWIKTTVNDGNYRPIIDQETGGKGWYTYMLNGKVGFGASYQHTYDTYSFLTGFSYINSTTSVNDNKWHHVLATAKKLVYFDGAGWVKSYTYVLYVDGIQENTATVIRGSGGSYVNISADLCWNIPVKLGKSSTIAAQYNDKLDDIRFYSTVLNATDIASLANEKYCPYPTNVSFSSTSFNSTIVNWDATANGNSWDLTYVESGQPILNGTTVNGLTSNSYFINGLTNNTSYDVYLTSSCNTYTSDQSNAFTFTTLCQSTSVTAITKDTTIQLNDSGTATINAADVNDSSLTSCNELANVIINNGSFDCANIGANTVTLTAADNEGHIATATATVTVLPAVLTKNITVYLDASGNVTITPDMVDNGSNTLCNTSYTLSLDKTSFDCSNIGDNTVVLSVSDGNGNIGTDEAIVTVLDTIAPTVITQNVTLSLGATFETTIIPMMINNGSSDNCAGTLTYSLSKTRFTCDDQGANTIELTVTDTHGNSATGTAIVTINQIITDVQVNVANNQFCNNTSSTTVSTTSSQIGVDYYLKNANGDILDGPIAGNGSVLTFNTGVITNTQALTVYGEKRTTSTAPTYALQFDGTDDKVNTSLVMPTTNTFTIEAWVWPNSANYDRLISNYNSSGIRAPGELVIDSYNAINNGRALRAYLVGPSNVIHEFGVPNVLTLSTWNHIAVVFNNGNVKLYVNGIEVGTSTAPFTSFPSCTQTYSFGEDYITGPAEFLNGKLDDIRFWSVARSAQQITDNSNECLSGTETGLVALYDFDEGSGTTSTDKAGNYDAVFASTMATSLSAWQAGAHSCDNVCGFEMTQTAAIYVGANQTYTETTAVCLGSDYTFPDGTVALAVNAPLVHTSNLTSAAGCDSIIETTLNVNPIFNLSETVAICSGANYTFPDGTTQTGITSQVVYTSNLQTSNGCDSIIVTTVNVNPIYNQTETVTICEGSSYTFPDGTTQTNIVSPVSYTSTLQSISACDSIIVTTVNVNPIYTNSETVSICAGSDYTFPDGTTQTGITSQIIYTSTLATINGCDSLVETTINTNNVYNLTETVAICSGSDYTFHDGTTQTNLIADVTYTSVFQTTAGCDSLITTTVSITPLYIIDETVTVCNGSDYTFPDGSTQTGITSQVVYTSSLQSLAGCDSTIVTTVNVAPTFETQVTISVCQGASYTFPDGTTANITVDVSQSSTLASVSGCDSVIVTNVTVIMPIYSFNSAEVCYGSSYTFVDGYTEFNITGSMSHVSNLTSMTGCDSIVETTVAPILPVYANETVEVCLNSSYTFPDGHTEFNIVNGMLYTSTISSAAGCDSIIETTVTINPNSGFNGTENISICSGTDYTFPDGFVQTNITNALSHTSYFQSINGCDSVIVTNITITTLDASVTLSGDVLSAQLSGASYQWIDCSTNEPIVEANGQTFTPSVSGSYACIIQGSTCTVTSECIQVTLVGLTSLTETALMIYPNPAVDNLTIETDLKVIDIKIFSATGSLVQHETKNEFSVENLVNGVYFINITTEKGMIRTKFVKA